jgi:predicted AlkP superfamily phosphohydrolase/phosphomutase|tara:strand:+ start:932 stop:2941 length:2010 start_codon:yes stop_codon:yes gene_type:complete
MKRNLSFILITIILIIFSSGCVLQNVEEEDSVKLYWFIPDGMRTDPDLFNIYKWAEEGKLPNIKKMMDKGAYGFSIPDFPSHTPTNFGSLFTGAHPLVHGVADGPMHVEGSPLTKPSLGGFSSVAKKVPPIWKTLEEDGKKVVLLSIPGSTPPELEKGITIRGRWGGWGADTYKVVYEPEEKLEERKSAGRGFRLFFLGAPLTKFVEKNNANSWKNNVQSFSVAKEAKLESHGLAVYAYIYDSTNDQKVNYDGIVFSLDKENVIADLKQGEWSEWAPVQLKSKDTTFDSDIKIKVIKMWDNSNFRITILYNNLNRLITDPASVSDELTANVGPMVDFADNWPAQLLYEDEDKQTFLDEAKMTLDWHKKAVPFIYDAYTPDVFIQDIYTPNQMLESRWWHQYIDTSREGYSEEKAEDAWADILELYQGLDAILGEAMENADENTYVVLSSDHGVCSLKRLVKLNNLFAEKGWLKFTIDKKTGEPKIDWKNSKVIYLKMAHIYVSPDGLGGNWERSSGQEYEELRGEVIKALRSLKDDNGVRPVINAIKWEDAPEFFKLPTDRIGDIVLEVTPGYFWSEEMDEDHKIFVNPLNSGYKQTIDARKNNCMWTPFIITGPGIKHTELKEPISHVDQLPTILTLMGIDIPEHVQGRVLTEVISSGSSPAIFVVED